MKKVMITILFSTLFFGFAAATPFEKAVPVWAEGKATEMNSCVRFRAAFESATDRGAVLRVTGANAYRIRLNGTFVGYGPARAPKGFFRTDEWPLAAAIRRGRNELEIETAGYNCNSFYFQDQPAFLQAEVVCGGKVVAATGTDGDFTAETTERIRKVPRYSFQRTFAEAYRHGGPAPEKLALERRPPVRYLERIASYPKFEINDRLKIVSRAKAKYDPAIKPKKVFFVETDGKNPQFKAFAKSGLKANPWDDMQKVRFSSRTPADGLAGAAFALKDGESVMTDAGLNDCGFFGMTVKVAKPGRILFTFDEVLTDGEVDPTRMTCCNCVEWRFEQPGMYAVETFEPYVFRYANLTAVGGAFEISGLRLRTYKNPDAGRAAFRCSDPALERVFAAARETFVQNAVDVFTDCPSRERAGWLCDSFFIGRVNALLTGNTKLERLFLQNFAVSDGFENHPAGAIPMCYPADELRGRFIPNWAMWLVIEVEEYLKRSGDRATVDALRPRLVAFVDYLKTFRNSDGLLEKLPSWVFVEWSQANKLVQDVSYPSNMTWAEVLDVMNRLYGMPELAAEAEKVRETVRRQSWTGKWFCDNAVRQPDGTLKLSGECTETCQYYAFFFRTATPRTHPQLWKTLVDDFGPKRLAADGKTLRSHPEIWPSNAFIGNYLRLECLAREGLVRNVLDETKGFFLYMAERTGTLWEMISPTASCDHGFASHAAVYLFRDLIGIKSVDAKTRQIRVEPPKDIDLDWIEGTLPVSPTETVTVGWRRGEKPVVRWNDERGCSRAFPQDENRDVPDPRVRTFVRPVRVVWKSASTNGCGARSRVVNSDVLLKAGHGQVPEGSWGEPSIGCRLVNDGEAPGLLLDFGREIHGGLRLEIGAGARAMRLRVRFGESAAEAMSEIGERGATNDHAIRDEEVLVPSFGSKEIGNTGFRFVRLDLVTTGEVSLESVRAVSLMRPMKALGSFRCSDERLNRIWETAVRTVHLCCQDYLWDGIKRDRLVWMGDTHPETMAILSVFGSQDDVLPRSLDYIAAVTPTNRWMNNMGTYTLWWVRNVAEWYRFTGDRSYIEKHRDYLSGTLGHMLGCVTPTNVFAGIRRPFLDWPTEHNRPAVNAGVQGLAVVAFREGAFLADELGDEGLAARCRGAADRISSQRTLDPCGSKQAAAMLALSGLRDPKDMFDGTLGRDGHAGISTFYGYYMLEAMSLAGQDQRALETVRDYWGAMLDVGATSFWENFDLAWTNNCSRIDELPVAGKKDIHGDYGEFCYPGFRHSLCHGWSCGPAAWLINHVLGIRSTSVGCRTYEVKPFLGDLAWAEGSMALPGGRSVFVRVERGEDGRPVVRTNEVRKGERYGYDR